MERQLHDDICAESIFAQIYNKYAPTLRDFLYYKYGSQLDPADKVQEAFIKLWDRCKDVSQDKAKSFLFTVANNMMLNEIKHNKVVLRYKKRPVRSSTNESPEFIMEQEQYLQRYQEVLGKLSEEQRVAFLMNKVDGKKHQEIAEILGVTRKVVEYRIYSAFKILKEELEAFHIK